MYYKKIGKSLQNDIESERKGLTVNIKENPFKLDSSIITIYGANNLTQLQSIVNEIFVTNLLMKKPEFTNQISTIFDDLESESEQEEKQLKERSNIKILRQRGVKIFSSKCTHLGCKINSSIDSKLVCPCHGSKFNFNGIPENGPATEPLTKLELVKDKSGELVVYV